MIVALLAVLIGTTVTGYMMTTEAYWGAKWVEQLHEALAWHAGAGRSACRRRLGREPAAPGKSREGDVNRAQAVGVNGARRRRCDSARPSSPSRRYRLTTRTGFCVPSFRRSLAKSASMVSAGITRFLPKCLAA